MTTITLTINAATAEDLIHEVRKLQLAIGAPTSNAQTEPNPTVSKTAEPKKATAKKDKPVETPVVETPVVETPVVETPVAVEAGTSSLTKDDVQKALQNLSSSKDLATAKAVLAEFKNAGGTACARVSDLQVQDYEAFVARCTEASN